jgi:hypothetical protein
LIIKVLPKRKKNFHNHPYFIYPSPPSNTPLVENINRLDEEARAFQKKKIVLLSRHNRTHLGAFRTRE